MRIYEMFNMFYNNKKFRVNIDKNTIKEDHIYYSIVKRFSKESEKKYRLLDPLRIIYECEEYIKCLNLPDYSFRIKMDIQNEYLGYISLNTGKEEDRPKLIVMSKNILKSKFDNNKGKPWCVLIKTQSIGSNISSEFSIKYETYKKEEFDVMDIIYVDKWELIRGYRYITKYHRLII